MLIVAVSVLKHYFQKSCIYHMFPRLSVTSSVTSQQVVYLTSYSWGHSATITGCGVIDIRAFYDSRMKGYRSTPTIMESLFTEIHINVYY